MKRILYIIVAVLVSPLWGDGRGAAQTYVTIPDTAFAAYLRIYFPTATNGNQLDTSNVLVKNNTNIAVPGLGIVNLQGIQYFHSLKYLDCGGNKLTTLPPLPNTIIYINCSLNQLTTLPALPTSLQTLYCFQNQLITLPTLPNSLKTFNCDGGKLTTLPALPNSLRSIDCGNNQLTSLPSLPDSLQVLEAFNNKITCFPPFPTTIGWNGIFIFNNPFTCLPNYIDAMKTTATLVGQPLLSYPLCGIDNTSGCPVSTDVPTAIIIPNIFTPNGDSINDTFFVKGANLTNFSCKIYDRWGALLYQWTDVNAGWNGKDKNGTATDGTYFYVISYTDNTGKTNTKNGFFQLLR